ncbi:MAG: polyhydroxyalkanoate depolymerase, partial [Methylovirgula sp.]
AKMKLHYEQEGVGHYGVFNGSRFRQQIAPRIRAFHAEVAPVCSAQGIIVTIPSAKPVATRAGSS